MKKFIKIGKSSSHCEIDKIMGLYEYSNLERSCFKDDVWRCRCWRFFESFYCSLYVDESRSRHTQGLIKEKVFEKLNKQEKTVLFIVNQLIFLG